MIALHCVARFNPLKMNGQLKIMSFFPSVTTKRPASFDASEDQKTPPKRPRNDENQSPCKTPTEDSPAPLSPEQQKRIEQNKLQALVKLHEKKSNGLLVGFGPSWFKALEPEFSKPYFIELSKFVESERRKGTVYPPSEDVFTFTRASDIKDVNVIILGQDPYHGPNQAHGLSFSVKKGVPAPPSLKNMYQELSRDIDGFRDPGHGYLLGWAEQGVLMLNACLTVRAHEANSHKDQGWEKFTDAIISWFNKNQSGIVFILWGSYAQKKGAFIDKKRHHILKGVHPSPLSAHRGFFGCSHFSKCNELLKSDGKKTIDWSHLP
ncbi:hypothetical protein CHS0354_015282 [Potamilus streckersoni]|uniref:Uracil-DNA glycosylase n=1 Tax=Potamilus streckersoni TaxID=2493646 RepID=A0AAE0S085_9BIVA|nr:hypothetical protein CHS0354_015282 [Potamilus streckersoni]